MKIEKNIPAPIPAGRGRTSKHPFVNMEAGDSVFYAGVNTSSREYRAAMGVGKSKGWKFSGRIQDGGLRIWRVA